MTDHRRGDALRAELDMVEAEERLLAAKDGPDETPPEDYEAIKAEVREARRTYREHREAAAAATQPGDAAAAPETTAAKATTK